MTGLLRSLLGKVTLRKERILRLLEKRSKLFQTHLQLLEKYSTLLKKHQKLQALYSYELARKIDDLHQSLLLKEVQAILNRISNTP